MSSRRIVKQSLNQKLALIVVAAVMAAVVLISAASLWQEALRHTESKLEYLSATAAAFASATSKAAADEDSQAALAAMRGVARAPHLRYARVETPDGRLLAEIGSGVSLDSDAKVGASARATVLEALRSGSIIVSRQIVHGGRDVGRITMVADNSDLLPSLARSLLLSLLGAMAALGVGLTIAARMQRRVVRPLLNLTETVRQISQSHDYATKVNIESNDEVGDLCGGFNEMLTEIRSRESKIIDLALHDAETDLPNRVAFERDVAARIARGDVGLAILAVGIDRFHYVRGAIGYQPASDLLGELGVRLDAVAGGGVAARIGTDVICIAVEATDVDDAKARAGAILADAESPVRVGVNEIDVSLSVGVAVRGVHASTPMALIEQASIALDQARSTHSKVALFDQASYAKTARNLSLMADMARAFANGEMMIYLQPKLDLGSGEVASAEVLARWRHPERGMVPPDEFVVMAEETGGIGALTEWVLHETIACQRRLAAAGLAPSLAVNLSGRLLCDFEFVTAILPLLQSAPGQLVLEITETASIDNQEVALRNIDALAGAGARISIDDYGSGMSSLAYLKRIPADELKIDRAFISHLEAQNRDALMVKSTIDLAHALGMKVTAEGVETEAGLRMLAAMGCDCVQGYLIAKPMAETEFLRFLKEVAPGATPKWRALCA
jgi:predicted signal transduction protein with EAL and GGDEF domain